MYVNTSLHYTKYLMTGSEVHGNGEFYIPSHSVFHLAISDMHKLFLEETTQATGTL